MQLSRFRIQLKYVLWITFFWVLIAVFEFLIQYSVIIFLDYEFTKRMAWSYLWLNALVGVVAGLLGGSVLVFIWNRWLRTISYGRALLSIFITFTAIYGVVYLIINGISSSFNALPTTTDMLVEGYGLPLAIQYTNWLFIGLGTLFMLQVNDKYGPGVLKQFLLGRYFQPKREERLFMFLDLKSSTSLAESLGNEQYFHFLKDAYEAITPSIMTFSGEIYQYVGDEVVVSWRMKKASAAQDCVDCFFEIRKALQESAYFQEEYGCKPAFKAGIHGGSVVAGEMGVIKREIAFSGDVLNTTSRIQGMCNQHNTDLLISAYIREKLQSTPYSIEAIGKIHLRGKQAPLELFMVGIDS